MDRDTKKSLGWDYVCKPCELVYKMYGDLLRCDICNRRLKLLPPEEVEVLGAKWEAKEKESAEASGGKG